MREMLSQLWGILDEYPEYVVIGGMAATLLGSPRTTVDVDVVIVLPSQEVERVVALCERHNLRPGPDAAARLEQGRPVKFVFSRRFSVDIRLASFSLDTSAVRRAQEMSIFGHAIRVATPEDLIAYKLARWDPVDREDVRHVIRRLKNALDIGYLKEQIRTLMEEAQLPDLLERWASVKPSEI